MFKPSRVALAIVLSAAALPALVRGQTAPTFGRILEDRVELLDLRSATWRPIYSAPKAAVNGLSVAPAGDRLALLSWTRGTFSGHEYAELPAAKLLVIDTLGRVLATVPNVHHYTWCGGNCLAYLVGRYSEDSDWGFSPEGAGLLDLATGKTTRLPVPRYTVGITWNPADSGIYLRTAAIDPAIYRLELATRRLSRTALHDHQFSPSGEYYISDPFESDSLEVYDTRTNSPVDLSALRRVSDLIGWAGPAGDVLLAVRHVPRAPRRPGDPPLRVIRPEDIRPQRYLLYRISDGRMVDEAEGFLHQWAGAAQQRLVRGGRTYIVLDGAMK